MVDKLLNCPFCGSTPTFTSETDMVDNFDHSYSISCAECGFHLTDEYQTEVITRWNRRSASFECAALKQGTTGGNDPADCDWPICSCDPAADKVISALQEIYPSYAALIEERDRLREALVPFAKFASSLDEDTLKRLGLNPSNYLLDDKATISTAGRHGHGSYNVITYGDVRAARAALSSNKEG